MELHEKRRVIYVVTAIVLLGGGFLLRNVEWQGSISLHTLMELAATLLAAFVGAMALVRFFSRRDAEFLYIGTGFLGTALLDGFHAVVTSVYFQPYMPSDNPHLVPWSWIASRLFLSALMFISWLLWFRHRYDAHFRPNTKAVMAWTALATTALFFFSATVPLPTITVEGGLVSRPAELLPAIFFFMALAGYLYKGAWRGDQFEHWLVLSLIVGLATQTVFMPFSHHLYDTEFNLSHLLKKLSYILVLVGLLHSLYQTYRQLQAEEKELLKASAYARSLIEAGLDPLVTISAEGKITDVNQATEKVTGQKRAELVGMDFSDYFTEPDKAREGYRQVFDKGFVADYPLALRHSDGHVTDVLYNASVYRNEAGEVQGVFAAARDITGRKREELIRTQLAALVESSSDAIIGKTTDGIITSWNKGAEKIYGYTADEIIGKHITTLAPPSRHAEIHEFLEKIRRGETIANYESERIRKDGSLIQVALTLSPIKDASGALSGISTIARDITERKIAEEVLRREQALLNRIMVTSPVGIAVVSKQGQVTFANPQAEKIMGLSKEEITQRSYNAPAWHITAIDGGDFPEEELPFSRVMATRQLVSDVQHAIVWPDGRRVLLSINGAPIFDASGEIEGVVFAIEDITQRRQAEDELRESEAALKEAQRLARLGSWYMDLATNQVVWSEVLYQMYGFDPALPPPLYTESMKLFTPESWERLSTSITRTVETGIPYELELEMVPKDGGRKWMLARGELVRDERGVPVRVRGVVMDITERKQADQQLRSSEHGLAEAQRIAHLGNWELNLGSNALTWSDEIFRIFEIDKNKFGASYDAFLNAIHPDDRDMVNKAYTDSVANKMPYDIVHRLRMPDGRIKYVNEKCETYYGEDGKPLRSVGTVHDITERKRAEEELLERERHSQSLLRLSRTLERSQSYAEILNAAHEEVKGTIGYQNLWAYLFTDDKQYAKALMAGGPISDTVMSDTGTATLAVKGDRMMEEIAEAKEIVLVEDAQTDERVNKEIVASLGCRTIVNVPIMLLDRHMGSVGVGTFGEEGVRVPSAAEQKYLMALASHMAAALDRIHLLAERRKAENELRELNSDFVTLLENTGDFIYFKDKDSRIRFCSQTLADITGHHSWRDMIGKHDLEIFPAETARIYYEEELPIFQQGKALLNKTDPYFDDQGKQGWVNTNKWPVFGDDKKTVVGIFGISRDITELKVAEDRINELNRDLELRVEERTAQLEAANKELEAFSYSVSHDLRAPLRAIDGFSQILLEEYQGKLDDEGKRLLNVVRDNTNRMRQLIDDILKFSRAGRLELTATDIDMESLARSVFAEIQPSVDESKLQLEIEALPPAHGDSAMMHQVFANLISNAIKFSRNRTPAKIKVGCSITGGEAVYYVQDNGAGFDMQYADKLFGVFQRLHSVNEFEGTGIGLAIVKRIVNRHGGRVWAEGKVNEGATIFFSIPARALIQKGES